MICHALLVFSVLLSAADVGKGSTPAYTPTDVFFFNCGATSDNIDDDGRNWTAENRKLLSANSVNASFFSEASFQDSGVPQVPYMTARIFRSDFTYSFKVSPGWKFVRLHFYPTRYKFGGFDAANSFFSVTVNSFTLLNNFSADLTVRASIPESKSLIKEFIVPVNNRTLNLTFKPSPNSSAFVNGIEIVSMPDRLYSKGGFDDRITYVGASTDFVIDNTTAFETVYRLNVAGQDVGDTGMFRRWVSDDEFILSEASGLKPVLPPDVTINYTAKTPAYVAPEDVYKTYRTMGNVEHPVLNLNFNLTWLLSVDAGFTYLVRLHFCETLFEVTEPGQRIFSIFLRNQMAKLETDVIFLSGGSRIPVYLDFSVYVGSENGPSHDLLLELHPYEHVKPKYLDAILNGLEVLKLNNSEGNLAGPNPNPPPPSPTPKRDIPKGKVKSHVLVISLAVVGSAIVIAMFVVVVFLMKRKKKNKKEFSIHNTSKPKDSWTHLPFVTGSSHTKSATSLPSDLCRRFSILEIKSATNDFEKELIVGVGGFGSVYKGRIDGGTTLVAVKRLDILSNQGSKEFDTELEMLSMLRHKHLVSLIGYCDDENEMVLVYEYMPHGTLKDHLYKRNKAFDPPLSWKRRPVKLQNVPPEEGDLVRWVKSNYKRGTVDRIVDEDLKADITLISLEKFCEIAVRCVQDRGIERPSMNDVVWGLEFALQLHETGKKNNDVDSADMPRGEVGTTTDGEDLFSTTTGHVSESTMTDDNSAPLRSGSSWGVFSEIKEPKAR
ncbi:unnamed protein product [Thlaspi arvense]|uniref:Protein kinase domain-containing protein n=1 Tax=Thlaspi arvense TaxID=13288 RepID=A0AAU9TB64_THLAR|nr:unnamed protein product [Thlaspi arvense]